MKTSKTYFITAKVFEAIGFLLFAWCWIIYWPTINNGMCILLGYPADAFDLWTVDHVGSIIIGWILFPIQLVVLILEFLPPLVSTIMKYCTMGLVGLIGIMILFAMSCEGIQKWIRWNKEKLR